MLQEHINLLTLKELFLIISEKTEKPYIDKQYRCYMFELRSDAVEFMSNTPRTKLAEAKNYTQMTFCTEFYSLGIREIQVQQRNEDPVIIPIEKKDTKKQYYNHETNGNILLLKETSERKYLRELRNTTFLTPVLVNKRLPKHYPTIHYSYATTADADKVYFVLFSTLQEFEKWKKEQQMNWTPMEISLSKFKRIRGRNPVLINPLSDKLILTDEHIKIALEILKPAK